MATVLTAKPRKEFGKENVKKLRTHGVIPGVVYGSQGATEHVVLDYHDLDLVSRRSHGQTMLLDLEVEDANGSRRTEKVLIRELQRDPVSEKIIHADLYRVDVTRPVVVTVPVVGVGMPAGVKMGGLLETLTRLVAIRCLPQEIPPHIDVDITAINIGKSLHVSEVTWPSNVKVMSPGETALFTVLGKKAEEEEAAVAAVATEEAPAEPEVIGRKKKEGEEEGEEEGAEKGGKEEKAPKAKEEKGAKAKEEKGGKGEGKKKEK